MDFSLMQQMVYGNTRYTQNPHLTSFPIGTASTPGLIADSLYQWYTPIHSRQGVNVEGKKLIKVEQDQPTQSGFGKVEENVPGPHSLKRKLNNDVFEKMMHPTFKIAKLQPTHFKKEKSNMEKSGEGASNLKPKQTKEKLYHTF
jgi:hypothetical protein